MKKSTMAMFIITATILLFGCAEMKDIKTPEHRAQLQVTNNYQAVYRLLLRNAQFCDPANASGNLFMDNHTATVSVIFGTAVGAMVGYTVDIQEVGDGSHLDLYVLNDKGRARMVRRIEQVLQTGNTDICKATT